MKIRDGFVSNSSSSSFICPVCQEMIDIDDNDAVGEEDAVYAYGGVVPNDEFKAFLKEKGLWEEYNDTCADPDNKKYCPIYHMHHVTKMDVLNFLLARSTTKEEEVKDLIRQKFNNRDEFDAYIKENKK